MKIYEVLFIFGIYLLMIGLIILLGPIYAKYQEIGWVTGELYPSGMLALGFGAFFGGILLIIVAVIWAWAKGDL